MDGVTEAQRGQDTCLSSHSKPPFGFLLTAGVSEEEHCLWNPETHQGIASALADFVAWNRKLSLTTPNASLSFL